MFGVIVVPGTVSLTGLHEKKRVCCDIFADFILRQHAIQIVFHFFEYINMMINARANRTSCNPNEYTQE